MKRDAAYIGLSPPHTSVDRCIGARQIGPNSFATGFWQISDLSSPMVRGTARPTEPNPCNSNRSVHARTSKNDFQTCFRKLIFRRGKRSEHDLDKTSSLSRSCQGLVKVRRCMIRPLVKVISLTFSLLFRSGARSCQGLARILVKVLSRSCQGLVKVCVGIDFVIIRCHFVSKI